MYLKLNKGIPLSKIKDFISRQEVNQIFQEIRKKPKYKPIVVYSKNNQWQVDLVDLSKYSKRNAGINYLLCVIDVFSRKAFVKPIKRKSNTTTAMAEILHTNRQW
jgi:hypothetical protein